MQSLEQILTTEPHQDDIKVLSDGIRKFNVSVLGEYGPSYVVTAFAEKPSGEILAGVLGEIVWGWCHIWRAWVSEEHRKHGLGTPLMAKIENYAFEKGIRYARTETTDFQALGFYQKLGYQRLAELPEMPPGHVTYILTKELHANVSEA